MIVTENLRKCFGKHVAVDDISFSVSSGEVLGFLGPNGAGKTTTMQLITGSLAPTEGQVTVFGKTVQENNLFTQSCIGYLPEHCPLYEDMHPIGFLTYMGRMRGMSYETISKQIDRVIHTLSLQKVAYRKIEELSKGFKRRVALGQAILHDPSILILDEPTDGLDPNQKYQVRDLIASLSKQKIIIISTHILEEIDAICSRVLIIARGKILIDESPAKLIERSQWHQATTIMFEAPLTKEDIETFTTSFDEDVNFQISKDKLELHCFAENPENNKKIQPLIKKAISKKLIETPVKQTLIQPGRMDDVFRKLTHGEN